MRNHQVFDCFCSHILLILAELCVVILVPHPKGLPTKQRIAVLHVSTLSFHETQLEYPMSNDCWPHKVLKSIMHHMQHMFECSRNPAAWLNRGGFTQFSIQGEFINTGTTNHKEIKLSHCKFHGTTSWGQSLQKELSSEAIVAWEGRLRTAGLTLPVQDCRSTVIFFEFRIV